MADIKNLLDASRRPHIVGELSGLVDRTVAGQSGLTGMAMKSAFAAVKKADAAAVDKAVNQFLPRIVEELTPWWEKYAADARDGFGAFLAANEAALSDSLLSVGDDIAAGAPVAIGKLYSSLRGTMAKIINPVLPEFGEIIERNAS